MVGTMEITICWDVIPGKNVQNPPNEFVASTKLTVE